MKDSAAPSARFSEVLRHRVAGLVWAADAVSIVGDFVGLGALLLLAYERAGSVAFGPAALFAVQAIPGLLVGTVFAGRVGRLPVRATTSIAALGGALSLALPLLVAGMWPVIVAALGLGTVRAVSTPVRSAAVAAAVPDRLKTRLVALVHLNFSAAQVLGYVTGATLAVTVGASVAIIADMATFLLAAVLLACLPHIDTGQRSGAKRRARDGVDAVLGDPVLRVVVPGMWVAMVFGAVPEAMAPAVAPGSWVVGTMAASAAAAAVVGTALGRTDWLDDPVNQLRLASATPVALLAGAGALAMGWHPVALVAANVAIGASSTWIIGAQSLVARRVDPAKMASVMATMVAALLGLEGLGALGAGAITDLFGGAWAYAALAALTAAVPLVGLPALRRAAEPAPSEAPTTS